MDRLTHAEVGGPYSNREDAQRAIRAGNFDQDPAELSVEEGDSNHARTASKTAGFPPGEEGDEGPSPATPDVEGLPQPMPDQQVMPKSTKPAQMPGGAGGLPQNPMDPQFDGSSMATPGPDPLASTTAAVVEDIRAANPGMDTEALVRIASRAVAKLVEADFDPSTMRPHIEDPLSHKTPWQVVKDVGKTKPKGKPEEDGDDEGDDEDDNGGGSSLPFLPLPQLGGAGGAAEGSGMARVLPMLMV